MLDYLTIGSAPCDEECEQANVSGTNYERMRAECLALIRQIRRQLGTEPEGARLAAKFFRDGINGYYMVVCHYDSKTKAALDYAFRCEMECPARWDAQAKQELADYPVGVQA